MNSKILRADNVVVGEDEEAWGGGGGIKLDSQTADCGIQITLSPREKQRLQEQYTSANNFTCSRLALFTLISFFDCCFRLV